MELALNSQRDYVAESDQYNLWQILGIWAVVALPMLFLAWVIAPAIIPYSPLHDGITFWLLIIVGLAWQFVVSLIMLYQELGTLRWDVVRERIWLQRPRDSRTGEPNRRLYWWVVPALLFNVVATFVLSDIVDAPLAWLLPGLQPADYMDFANLATPEFEGAWWLLSVLLLSGLFNYFLGEELLFRGVLLPKMQGVFGKWDWVANTILFGCYHLHLAWGIPGIIVSSFAYAWPSRRFRSIWLAVIVHGVEGLFMMFLILGIILGLA